MEDLRTLLLENSRNPFLLVGSLVLGALAIVVGYIFANRPAKTLETTTKTPKSSESKKVNSQNSESGGGANPASSNTAPSGGKRAKNKKRREIQQEFTHSWMVGALKGHTAPVLDINFSSNGKYLASCAEDSNLEMIEMSSSSDSGMSSAASSPPVERTSIEMTTRSDDRAILSRRQKKNRMRGAREQQKGRREDIPYTDEELKDEIRKNFVVQDYGQKATRSWRMKTKRNSESSSESDSQRSSPPQMEIRMNVWKVRQSNELMMLYYPTPCYMPYSCLLKRYGFSDKVDLYDALMKLVMSLEDLAQHGYPVYYSSVSTCATEIQRGLIGETINTKRILSDHMVYFKGWTPQETRSNSFQRTYRSQMNKMALRAPVGKPKKGGSVESSDQDSSSDSENVNSIQGEDTGYLYFVDDTVNKKYGIPIDKNSPRLSIVVERNCSRCREDFPIYYYTKDYAKDIECHYHPELVFCPVERTLLCKNCGGLKWSRGCTVAKQHVWSGSKPGLNGPLNGYQRTQWDYGKIKKRRIYALDCEMCFTKVGLELARISIVDVHGTVIYDTFVKPENPVIDYNTRFSGITKADLEGPRSKSIKEVHKDLSQLIDSQSIIIGHALENDLRALKLVHSKVIDTSLLRCNGTYGPVGNRISLRNLVSERLGRTIQVNAHDSIEDARVAMELVLDQLSQSDYHV